MMTNVKGQMKSTNVAPHATVRTSVALRGAMGKGKGEGKGKGKGEGKGKGKGDEEESITVAGKGKGKGKGGSKHFEFSFGGTCEDHSFTGGFGLGECLDYVDKDEDGYGLPRSHHFLYSEDGPPVYEAFLNFGCEGDAAATGSISPTDGGFPENYEVGTCVDVGGYFGKAGYVDEMHYPDYDAVMFGYGVSPERCNDGNLLEYEIERVEAGGCIEDEGEFFMYDLSGCSGGSVAITYYTDNTCTTPTGSPEVEKLTECLFDLDDFVHDYEEEEYSGYFQYAVSDCHVENP